MANISATSEHVGSGLFIHLWATFSEADVPLQIEAGSQADKSVQIEGTFGGGSLSLLGSNDGTNFQILDDMDGSPITLSAAGIRSLKISL